MDRLSFHRKFGTLAAAIFPVIHVLDEKQAERNVRLALNAKCCGVFLINHDFPHLELLPAIRHVRGKFPDLWLGVNFLGVTGKDAFPILAQLAKEGFPVDGYWADDARINERRENQPEAEEIGTTGKAVGWHGTYFGGTAFKKQRPVEPDDYETAARIASSFMDAVTTSGVATGSAADLEKISSFRKGCGDTALALASGVTPENVHLYALDVDAVLVATGINVTNDFYNIDPDKLALLMQRNSAAAGSAAMASVASGPADREDRWYLYNMAPTEREGLSAWLDPSSIYINANSFNAVLDDLLGPFVHDDIDVVAAPDAMGFILGSAIAARLGKGFLAIRKAGKLPVKADIVNYKNYTGRDQELEMRLPAFEKGTKVLLVDQWIETGGTMEAAIKLIERQGGTVAGIATICIEESHGAGALRDRYKICTAVIPGSEFQVQCNSKKPDHFADYRVETIFPQISSS